MKLFLQSLIIIFTLLWASVSNAAVISGNLNGDITLIFVYDYQCVHCHNMYPLVQQLEAQFPNLRIEMMPTVLWTQDQTRNTNSLYEASAAIAATHTNQFWDFTNRVMAQSPMTNDQITALLNKMGLNSQQFINAMHSTDIEKQVMQGQAQMHDRGYESVPLFVIYPSTLGPEQGITLVGEQSFQALASAVQNEQQEMQHF